MDQGNGKASLSLSLGVLAKDTLATENGVFEDQFLKCKTNAMIWNPPIILILQCICLLFLNGINKSIYNPISYLKFRWWQFIELQLDTQGHLDDAGCMEGNGTTALLVASYVLDTMQDGLITPVIFTATLQGRYWHPRYTDKESEAQEGQVTGPKSHSMAETELTPTSIWLQSLRNLPFLFCGSPALLSWMDWSSSSVPFRAGAHVGRTDDSLSSVLLTALLSTPSHSDWNEHLLHYWPPNASRVLAPNPLVRWNFLYAQERNQPPGLEVSGSSNQNIPSPRASRQQSVPSLLALTESGLQLFPFRVWILRGRWANDQTFFLP